MSELWVPTPDMQQQVATAMKAHTFPMTAALSRIISDDEGTAVGTGTYIRFHGNTYVLTNDHVVSRAASFGQGIAHNPLDGDKAHRLIHPFQAMGKPVDAAITRVDAESWARTHKSALTPNRIEMAHRTDYRELFFIQGFPGERSRFTSFLPGVMSTSVPYQTQEVVLPRGFDPSVYLALRYSPENARYEGGRSGHLPLPPGFSGSLVWNTRFVERKARDWVPQMATVTGLVCEWGQGQIADIILAVRIELVRPMILRALREEAAYFRYLRRIQNRLPGGQLDDWAESERNISGLS